MPQKIGRWLVGPTLGEGGFSKVKLGTDEETGERVALKLLKKEKLAMSANSKVQVEREIAAMVSDVCLVICMLVRERRSTWRWCSR